MFDEFKIFDVSNCFTICSNDEEKFRQDLMNIARTTLSSKILTQHKEKFSKLAVDAVLRLKVRIATEKQLK